MSEVMGLNTCTWQLTNWTPFSSELTHAQRLNHGGAIYSFPMRDLGMIDKFAFPREESFLAKLESRGIRVVDKLADFVASPVETVYHNKEAGLCYATKHTLEDKMRASGGLQRSIGDHSSAPAFLDTL